MLQPAQNPASRTYTSRSFPRPRIVLSQCLELEACRHDGQRIRNSFVAQLMDFVDLIPICPEVEIGLGTPRPTIRMVARGDETTLIQPSTGRDLTEKMERFSRNFLDKLGPVDGFVLKSGSPSCGTANVSVYQKAERSPAVRREPGIFARHVLERFDDLAIEDEGRLRNFYIRHHFLTRLFSLTELRELGDDLTMAGLVEFHRRYKHLLLLYDEPGLRQLGPIVANAEGRAPQEVFDRYALRFRRALAEPPEREAHTNVLHHIYGHFKRRLDDRERHEFLAMVEEMRHHHLTLSALLSVIRTWSARFDYAYMADQSYLEPYPRQLLLMRDSGKGIDP